MMVIDGRQAGYSLGAFDSDMGFWLLQFGAAVAVAVDGGGSAAMLMENCGYGNPIPLTKSSYIPAAGRERISASHLGVYALPLNTFVSNVVVARHDHGRHHMERALQRHHAGECQAPRPPSAR